MYVYISTLAVMVSSVDNGYPFLLLTSFRTWGINNQRSVLDNSVSSKQPLVIETWQKKTSHVGSLHGSATSAEGDKHRAPWKKIQSRRLPRDSTTCFAIIIDLASYPFNITRKFYITDCEQDKFYHRNHTRTGQTSQVTNRELVHDVRRKN